MFERRLPTYDPLTPDGLDAIERGWRRIVSELGVEFLHDGALELFRRAGQRVDGALVRFDPDWVLEQVAAAPKQFRLRGRNPARSVDFAADRMVFCSGQSAPFVREGSERRNARFDDFVRMVRLTHVVDDLDTPGYPVCEPADRPPETRHLDLQMALVCETDKPYGAAQFDPVGVRDSIAMAEIVHGGRPAIEREPALFGIINANSPRRFDTRMIGSLIGLAEANQVSVVTPFILMGAMGPVSIPAALAQQTAEALVGIALAQLVRPGCPAVLGSFVSHTDMQSGSPGFGGPESAIGLLVSGQIARRYGLLWRSGGGGLTSSQVVDAQAAAESFATMQAAFLAGANLVLHTAGWLESGLVACFEKYALDIDILRILQREFTPLDVSDDPAAFAAFSEAGAGGHFFGTDHTLEHFRDCFYRPLVFSTENYERWESRGSKDTAVRAGERVAELLANYQQPPLDESVAAELEQYVARRKAEIEADQ
ncbi:MAG TPA: trimethylamine methyltransferase family protein [Gaiellales bacterium]|nr:trimethylamine methyltransferase family protein [Gaiellales bacterium]